MPVQRDIIYLEKDSILLFEWNTSENLFFMQQKRVSGHFKRFSVISHRTRKRQKSPNAKFPRGIGKQNPDAARDFLFSKNVNFLGRSKYSGESFFYAAENEKTQRTINCHKGSFWKFQKFRQKLS
jgi:hypothetical protein